MTQARLIAIAGVIAWSMVGLPAFIHHAGPLPYDFRWIATFALFGAVFALDLRRPRLLFLGVESAAAIALVLLRCNGYEGALLAVIAMQLGARLDRRRGVAWVGLQTLLLGAATAFQAGPVAAVLLAPPYLGFQLVAFFTFDSMRREAAANAELRSLQQMLAGASRMAERLRISHELHDALGHRLTALTLNLEAALQKSAGPGKEHVEKAQSLARQLLAEVREIVADSTNRDAAQLAESLQALASAVPQPRVHLEIAEGLRIADPERAHILLRCAQEIVTNAARHSAAQNLWIVVRREGDAVRIRAHDDGRGGNGENGGFGLRGMRERVERAGGELRIETEPGRGFGVSAWLPL